MSGPVDISRFSLTTANASALAVFYQAAFGCRRLAVERLDGSDFETIMGVQGGAQRIILGLGMELVELLQFDRPGLPYPKPSVASDVVFQHCAIVVSSMKEAYQRVLEISGWTPISPEPQHLPASSGGVTAFKFRDPDGHPLELIAFAAGNEPEHWREQISRSASRGDPCGLYLGIDHSALSVSDTARSIVFYQRLGFRISAQSHNIGPEQDRLDGLDAADVEVTALVGCQEIPHLELLCYRSEARDHRPGLSNNDTAASRLVLKNRQPTTVVRRMLRDPDGHHLMIE